MRSSAMRELFWEIVKELYVPREDLIKIFRSDLIAERARIYADEVQKEG